MTTTVSWLMPLPTLVTTFLALPAFVLLPWMTGSVFMRHSRNKLDLNEIGMWWGISWIVGFLLLFVAASMLALLGVLNVPMLGFSVIGIYGVDLLSKRRDTSREIRFEMRRSSFATLVLLLVAGILPVAYFYNVQPFPLTFGESYSYVLSAVETSKLNIVNIFEGHPPVTSVMFGIISALYNLHPFYIWSSSNYLLHLLYPFLVYSLSYALTRKRLTSLFAAIISPWMYGWAYLLGIGNKSLLVVLYPLGLFLINCVCEKEKINFSLLIRTTLFLAIIQILLLFGPRTPAILRVLVIIGLPLALLVQIGVSKVTLFTLSILPFLTLLSVTHPYESILVTLFIFSYIFGHIVKSVAIKWGSRRINVLSLLGILILIFGILNAYGIINYSDNFVLTRWIFGNKYEDSAWDINAKVKYNRLTSVGTQMTVYLFLGSLLLMFLFNEFQQNSKRNCPRCLLPMAFVGAITFTVMFLPDGHLVRAGSYLNVIFSILISHLMFSLGTHNKSLIIRLPVGVTSISINWRLLYFFLVLLVLMPQFQMGRSTFVKSYTNANPENYFSFIQTYEVEAFQWIERNYSNMSERGNIILISDPYTMYLFKSLTATETALPEYVYIYDREYSEQSLKEIDRLRERLFSVYDSEISYKEVFRVGEGYSKVLIIVSERTATWISSGKNFPSFPTTRISKKTQELFSDENYFNLCFNVDDKIYIFEPAVNPPLGKVNQTLILQLSFDEGSGNIIHDSSYLQNHGILFSESSTPAWISGITGQALELRSSYKEYVEIPHSNQLDGMNAITVTLWLYNNNTQLQAQSALISKPPPNFERFMEQPYYIELSKDNIIRFLIRDGNKSIIDFNTPSNIFSDENWTFLTCTWDGIKGTIYVNAVAVAECRGSGSMYSTDTNLFLGRNTIPRQPNPRYYNGAIDELHIYNRCLSYIEIRDLFISYIENNNTLTTER